MYYIELFKINFKNSIVFKFDTILSIFGGIILLVVNTSIWQKIADTNDMPISIDQMILYQIIGVILFRVYSSDVATFIGNKIKSGQIAIELIRPQNFTLNIFSQSQGKVVSKIIFDAIPVIIFSLIFYSVDIHISLKNIILFSIILILNLILYWIIFYIVGLIYFIFVEAGWFVRILTDLIGILSGSFIPIWLFPKIYRDIAYILPFHLFYQFPQSILINEITIVDIYRFLTLYFVWLLIFILLIKLLWNYAYKKLTIQGG